MKRIMIAYVIVTILVSAFYVLEKNNVFYIIKNHPIKKLTVSEIDYIEINGVIKNVETLTHNNPQDSLAILGFLSMYNKAKLHRNQELNTTPEFTINILLIDGNKIRILGGDTTYCYICYKDKEIIAYAPELVKYFENMKTSQNNIQNNN